MKKFLKEYTLVQKVKLKKIIDYLYTTMPSKDLNKILEFYRYSKDSPNDIEDIIIYDAFLTDLKKLAKENDVPFPKDLE